MHLLVHFLIFQREGVLRPAPTRAAPLANAWRTFAKAHACKGPCTRQHARALAGWLTPYTSRANSAGGMR